MKTLIFLISAALSQSAFGLEGTCTSHPDQGVHEAFCQNLSKQNCSIHSGMCTWEKHDVRIVTTVKNGVSETYRVIEKAEHACRAKEGTENFDAFCGGQNKMTCAVHSMCEWE